MKLSKNKVSELGKYSGFYKSFTNGFSYRTNYITMKDGAKLAADSYLPKYARKDLPTIIYFSRYCRAFEAKPPFNTVFRLFFGVIKRSEITFFTKHGYACLVVDIRGTGASSGTKEMEFSEQERQDSYDVINWVTKQKWSNGKVATAGSSYTGTTAEFALTTHHPAIKACVPISGIYDLYSDVNFPGGVCQAPFINIWRQTTKALDTQDLAFFGKLATFIVSGVKKVSSDLDDETLNSAMSARNGNYDILSNLHVLESRDQKEPEIGFTTDDFSLFKHKESIEASNVPIMRITGWYDGGMLESAIKAGLNTKNTKKVLIGPWDHGASENISPFVYTNIRRFKLKAEMLRFLDFHVKGIENGIDKDPKFQYYQMGKFEFLSSDDWPDKNVKERIFYLGKNKLLNNVSKATKPVNYKCDYTISSGKSVRWNSLTPQYRKGKISYGNRKAINDKMVIFRSEPLKQALAITGNPLIELFASIDSTDVSFFVYLEDVTPKGKKSTYITEGILRGIHRKTRAKKDAPYKYPGPFRSFKIEDIKPIKPHKIYKYEFGLLPISYLVPKGNCLQISISVCDCDHFEIPKDSPESIQIHIGEQYPSKLIIPMNDR